MTSLFRATLLIARRDFRAYFTSPVAYIIMAVFFSLMGFFFIRAVGYFLSVSQQFMQYSQGPRPTVSEIIVGGVYETMGVILLFIVPAITMRLFAEERRDRTDVLLFSAPIDSWAIILGKFFAALGFVGVLLVGTLPYPIILLATSNLDPGILFSSYCGLILLVASFIAVGLFFSAMTENQVIAFVLTMGSLLFMWVLAGASYSVGPILGEIIRYASIFTHFSNFGAGVLDTSDILYYLSLIGLGLFATNLAFDANQWS